jgi:hypothetical protein
MLKSKPSQALRPKHIINVFLSLLGLLLLGSIAVQARKQEESPTLRYCREWAADPTHTLAPKLDPRCDWDCPHTFLEEYQKCYDEGRSKTCKVSSAEALRSFTALSEAEQKEYLDGKEEKVLQHHMPTSVDEDTPIKPVTIPPKVYRCTDADPRPPASINSDPVCIQRRKQLPVEMAAKRASR